MNTPRTITTTDECKLDEFNTFIVKIFLKKPHALHSHPNGYTF